MEYYIEIKTYLKHRFIDMEGFFLILLVKKHGYDVIISCSHDFAYTQVPSYICTHITIHTYLKDRRQNTNSGIPGDFNFSF